MYAVRRRVENVYLVRERDRRRTTELLVLVLAALPVLAVLFAVVWTNLQTYQVGYQIGNIEKQREKLFEKRRQLLIERAEAASLVRMEKIARGSLGLGPARPEQLVLIRDSAALPAPPRPAAPGAARPELIGPPAPPSVEEGF
jgi:cell division protein FtsL